MEFKKGQTVFLKKENTKIQNPPHTGKIHSVDEKHVVLRTIGGTGYYKAKKDNLSHERKDSWLHQKYKTEEAPANSVGGGAVAGIGVDAPGKEGSGMPGVSKKSQKKYADQNAKEAGAPRKTLALFMQGK